MFWRIGSWLQHGMHLHTWGRSQLSLFVLKIPIFMLASFARHSLVYMLAGNMHLLTDFSSDYHLVRAAQGVKRLCNDLTCMEKTEVQSGVCSWWENLVFYCIVFRMMFIHGKSMSSPAHMEMHAFVVQKQSVKALSEPWIIVRKYVILGFLLSIIINMHCCDRRKMTLLMVLLMGLKCR